jgi:hypothetical protein
MLLQKYNKKVPLRPSNSQPVQPDKPGKPGKPVQLDKPVQLVKLFQTPLTEHYEPGFHFGN